MKVAFIASEAAPYAKTGGLADVAGSLPKFLARLGVEVKLFMPLYRQVGEKNLGLVRVLDRQEMDWPGGRASFSVLEHRADGFSVYFIEKDEFYDRDHLYGTSSGDYPDNGERFAFFSRAVLEALKAIGFSPHVIHAHDWQAATTITYLKHLFSQDPFFMGTRSLFTVHNLAYQGLFDGEILSRVGLPPSLFTMDGLEFHGKANFLKGGILYSTAINTVSPQYAVEIQTPDFGCGLDGLLHQRSEALYGILNGVDYSDWNPLTDKLIPSPFDADDLTGKISCKRELLELFGLPHSGDAPVAGMVTRLAAQKGLDIVCEALEEILRLGFMVIILGTGDRMIQDFLVKSRAEFPSRLGLKIAFDEKIAHTIYAGSDMFLIPSRYEPCGLTQMYSLKYGTVPVVRATGGLEDTIEEFAPKALAGNGFKFAEASSKALVGTLEKALLHYRCKEDWSVLVRNGMKADFSWDRSAKDYLCLYKKIAGSD